MTDDEARDDILAWAQFEYARDVLATVGMDADMCEYEFPAGSVTDAQAAHLARQIVATGRNAVVRCGRKVWHATASKRI